MPSLATRVYFRLPAFLQDAAISALGYLRRWQRFGPMYRRYLDELLQSQWASADDLRVIQLGKLRRLLTECAGYVPYYRQLFADIGFDPLSVRDLDDLKRIPILDKETLRSRTSEFHNRAPWRKPIEVERTSGSTGTPMAIPMDRETMSVTMALLERQYRWMGVSFFQRHARFGGAVICREDHPRRPWRWNRAWNQLLCSTYHLTPANMAKCAEVLERFRPRYLHGYPSSLTAFARWLNSNAQWAGRIQPRAILATAETLYDFQREEIESAFGCKVFNQYGSAEGAPFIGECEAGRLHVNSDSGIVEFLRPDGTQAEPGEEGQMVVTSFRTFAAPLVRYAIGDYAMRCDGECPCGRKMPLIERIYGRHDDVMVTTDRGIVGRLSQVTKVAPQSFVESQIEETGLNEFVFRYVPDTAYFQPGDLEKVEADMRRRLGSSIRITFEQMEQIPRGPHGKYRSMIGLPREKWPEEYR